MISVAEALALIRTHTRATPTIRIPLHEAIGYACAAEIYSPIDFPSFPQSAVDGYAFSFNDLQHQQEFEVQCIVQAGDTQDVLLEKGNIIRLFTGARIPEGADTVIMQEATQSISRVLSSPKVLLHADGLIRGANIRPKGSQSTQGQTLLSRGDSLTPASLSLLAGVGLSEVAVFKKPKVTILHTGKELVRPGHPILPGQVYESNSFGLQSALSQMHVEWTTLGITDDDLDTTVQHISHALEQGDLLLITGGVSVGDYDYVTQALSLNGVKEVFHKIKQKPGKPLYFGTKQEQLIFGLPGNPASVLTCFYMYVYPCIRRALGFNQEELLKLPMRLSNSYAKKAGLAHFVKGRIEDGGISILDHQESYKMNSFALANAILHLTEDTEMLHPGDEVDVYLLPQ